MSVGKNHRICLVPHLRGVGGVSSFQQKLVRGLEQRGIPFTYDLSDRPYAAVLIAGGYKNLAGIWQARRRGAHIVQRLDGMNWLHRRLPTGLRHYLRAEYGNLLLAFTRRRLVDHIVYQSRFSQTWWERARGPTRVSKQVVYNGVDLNTFNPSGPGDRPLDHYKLLVVEASLSGGYETGLETAVLLGERLLDLVSLPVELTIAGRVDPALRQAWQSRSRIPLHFTGQVPNSSVPELDRSAHLLYSADLNAACPNTVVEALACGLPVAAFDTGALPEMVSEPAGKVVSYGGDPWKLDPPDTASLAHACAQILQQQDRFRKGARERAEAAFGVDPMVDAYIDALLA